MQNVLPMPQAGKSLFSHNDHKQADHIGWQVWNTSRGLKSSRGFVKLCLVALATLVSTAFILFLLWHSALLQSTVTVGQNMTPSRPSRDLKLLLHPDEHVSREPGLRRYSWNITKSLIEPDGVKREVLLINGQFPGPTIEVRSGDIIEVEVLNHLEDATSLHWHGLHMRGFNEFDGPVGITQCPIPVGGRFVYRIPTGKQAGTFWFHAHSELQRADGLYGGLIIHDPNDYEIMASYDEELLLLVGDWYHSSAEKVRERFLSHDGLAAEPCPDSLLINGGGYFECAKAVPARPLDCTDTPQPQLLLDASKRYRVRTVNVGSLTGFSIAFPDAEMNTIRVDGGLPIVSHRANSIGILSPGERVDFLLWWPESSVDTEARVVVSLDTDEYCVVPNFALTPTQTFSISVPTVGKETEGKRSPELSYFDLREAKGPMLASRLPDPGKYLMLYVNIEVLSRLELVPHGFVNRTTWEPQQSPLLTLERYKWDRHQLVPWTGNEPVWVEFTINNVDTVGHPFHLHGFNLYIVSSYAGNGGWDYYNPFTPWKEPRGGPFNLVNPIMKDTIYVPAYGYVVIRFLADNEGIWALHCHVLWHQASGMAMAVQVMGDEGKGLSGTPQGLNAKQLCRAFGS